MENKRIIKLIIKYLNHILEDVEIIEESDRIIGIKNEQILFKYSLENKFLLFSNTYFFLAVNMFNISQGDFRDIIEEYIKEKFIGSNRQVNFFSPNLS